MTGQRDLFVPHRGRSGLVDYVPARASDPESSWQAARTLKASGELSRQQARALALVTETPQTAAELARGDYRLEIMLRKRLPELREGGQVTNGAPRDGAQTWRRA